MFGQNSCTLLRLILYYYTHVVSPALVEFEGRLRPVGVPDGVLVAVLDVEVAAGAAVLFLVLLHPAAAGPGLGVQVDQ